MAIRPPLVKVVSPRVLGKATRTDDALCRWPADTLGTMGVGGCELVAAGNNGHEGA
jgi:hypothetical protein